MNNAYKILAAQENISNKKAKSLIDSGLVSVGNQKVNLARNLYKINTKFNIKQVESAKKIHEDEDILVIDKPSFTNSSDIEKKFNYPLIHRLDFGTSGVLCLAKNENFRQKVIQEFKEQKVVKIYYALVNGIFSEEIEVNEPIKSIKKNNKIKSIISSDAKPATSIIQPYKIIGKKSLLKIQILTGRSHQIRVHLNFLKFPIIGDTQYGGVTHERIMLHAHQICFFDYKFYSKLPKDFTKLGF